MNRKIAVALLLPPLLLSLARSSEARTPGSLRDGTWSTIPGPSKLSPSARLSFGSAFDSQRNRILIFGGAPYSLNDVWSLALSGPPTWSQVVTAGTPPTGRYGSGAIYDSFNDRLIVFGGNDGSPHNDVWALSLNGTPTWTQLVIPGPAPSPRFLQLLVYDALNKRMVVFGGHDGSSPLNDTWALSLSGTPAWTQLASGGPSPPPRDLTHGIYDPIRQRLVMFGGWNGSYLGDTWTLSLGNAPAWTQLSTATSPSPRREFTSIYDPVRDRMVIFGGFNGFNLSDPSEYLDEVWALSLSGTPNWQFVISASPPATPRYGHQSAYDPTGDRMVAFGGYGIDPTTHYLNYIDQTLALSLSGTPAWSTPALSAAPSPRREYSAVYDPTDNEMILFSGSTASGALDDRAWVLSLGSDPPSWFAPIVAGPAPHSRHGHSAVWDPVRGRMLMFGGYDDYDLVFANDLWQLTVGGSPAWTQVVTSGTRPSGRLQQGMIYDPMRDRLVMFGGIQPFLGDLWELPLSGPNALHWSPLSAGGTPPSPRWGFSMIYDPVGDRAVLFGGTDGNPLNEVWTLDFSGGTPVWNLIDTGGPNPPPRFVHTAIYDPLGTRMVTYGGATPAGFLGDIWELRLGAHLRWKQLRPDNADPGPRDLLTAIYYPPRDQMVFFGGFTSIGQVFFDDTWFLTWARQAPTTQADEVESYVEGGRIRLVWHAGTIAPPEKVSVYRRVDNGDWDRIGSPSAMTDGTWSIVDSAVSAGSRYGYRLGIPSASGESFIGETEVVVPARLLTLSGIGPNPASDMFRVSFVLPDGRPARIDLIDLAGRVVMTREVGSLGPGSHAVELGRGLGLRSGIYFVRLHQGVHTAMARLSIVR